MPLKLIPPREGKTTYWYVRGKYLGLAVDRSTGTIRKRLAAQIQKAWEGYIERGDVKSAKELPAPAHALAGAPVKRNEPEPEKLGPEKPFLAWAMAYRKSGGEKQYIKKIIEFPGAKTFLEKAVQHIDQDDIDGLASEMYPRAPAATRNRNVYTPISAVLKHAGIERKIRRPKGWRGKRSTSWLRPEQAFALFTAADSIEAEFGLFLRMLVYTGMRLSEALNVRLGDIHLEERAISLPTSKNGEPRGVYLPEHLVRRMTECRRVPGKSRSAWSAIPTPILQGEHDQYLFRYHKGGAFDKKLKSAMRKVGLSFPRREGGFHICCHTYGRWMKKWGGLDTFGLVETDRWKDPESAARYGAGEPTEAAKKSDLLPVEGAWNQQPKSEIA